MKNYIKYFGILSLGMLACEPEFENPVDEPGFYTSGEVSFDTYVALGNSLTAGYADGALYLSGQQNSYPKILAEQFAKVEGADFDFVQPLVADNAGGLLAGGEQIMPNRLVLEVRIVDGDTIATPKVYTGAEPTTDILKHLTGPFNNLGVPGAKSFHLLAEGYGNPMGLATSPLSANPYFVRFASSPETSIIEDAVAQDPTFFTLWIGNNDVLDYTRSGGLDEAVITDPAQFQAVYAELVNQLTANDAEGVLVNIPDVTNIPYFTTVPNNALVLDAETAARLTGFFRAVAGIYTQALIQRGVPAEQAQILASQYAIDFQAGPNRFIIDVPATQENPLGFRQMTEEELLVFRIDRAALAEGYGSVVLGPEVMQVLGILQAGGQPSPEQAQLVLNAVSGIDDRDALSQFELERIGTARNAYNETILSLAQSKDLAFFDAAAFLERLATEGIPFDAGTITNEYATGGAFSLDGIHLTPRGNAFVANQIIEVINETYGSTVPKVNPGNYNTITPSNDVD